MKQLLVLLASATLAAADTPSGTTLLAASAASATTAPPAFVAPVQSVAPPPSTTPPAPVFGGLVQVWQEIPQAAGQVPSMKIRRAELSARAEIGDGITWGLVVDPALVADDGVTATPFLTSAAPVKTASGVTGVKRLSVLKMAYVAMDRPFAQVPAVKRITAGQFKVPFGMEGLAGGAEIDTVERAMQTARLVWSDLKDLGFMAQFGTGPFDLWAGGFQGEGQNRGETNNALNLNVRATARPASWLAVGAAWQTGRAGKAKDLNEHGGGELSCAWKPGGVPVRLKGEYAFGALGPRGKAAGVRTGYGHAGVELWPGHVELVVRYDWLDADRRTARDWRTEGTAGVNLWLASRRAKLQWNYVRVDEPTPKKKDDLMRVNVQANF